MFEAHCLINQASDFCFVLTLVGPAQCNQLQVERKLLPIHVAVGPEPREAEAHISTISPSLGQFKIRIDAALRPLSDVREALFTIQCPELDPGGNEGP